jgi:hypothetical protein
MEIIIKMMSNNIINTMKIIKWKSKIKTIMIKIIYKLMNRMIPYLKMKVFYLIKIKFYYNYIIQLNYR